MNNQTHLTHLILDPEEGLPRTIVTCQWYLSSKLDHLYQDLSFYNTINDSRFVACVRTVPSRERGGDAFEQRAAHWFDFNHRPFKIEGIPSSASRAYIVGSTVNTYSAALYPTW
jgi:hypothetical protein